ncbi:MULTISPECIES: hypothetical protein [Thiorhodovibrio]|uniref:hypothetical protein n=1 Tax=Thiorhodovibrio TaxID=61593 RepID=UPI001F5DF486|nr:MULTISPECIES: hypothetical protein [Thiorhodovibrio]WPL13424.1 hypothetical protein Thiosp_03225 [Thiorhodovibrio litoralis]
MNRRKRQGLGSTEAVRVEPIHGGQDIINGLLDLHPVAAVCTQSPQLALARPWAVSSPSSPCSGTPW